MSSRAFIVGAIALSSIGLIGGPLAGAGGSATVPDPIATPSGFNCPSGPNSHGVRLWIHVTKWCIVPGVRRQAQFKVQMRIHNQSNTHSLDISQDNIRVVVRNFDPDRWSPSSIGEVTRARPIETSFQREPVWAVPASADGAYDVFPNHPQLPTFATHWPVSRLGPSETFNPSYHYGDLVFNLPVPNHVGPGSHVKDNIVGVAYVKGRDIIALCPPDSWGEHARANSF